MEKLSQKKCLPCSGEIPPMEGREKNSYKEQIDPEWEFTHGGTRLMRKLKLKNFVHAMDIAIEIGKIAEEQNHHPELHVGWGHLDIEIWTHKINNLVEADFIFAAKSDEIIKEFT